MRISVKLKNNFVFRNKVEKVLFIPYAMSASKADDYTASVRKPLASWGFQVNGIHESSDEVQAVKEAQAIFVGGGNTFLLLKTLYEKHLVETIRSRVLEGGIPFMGSSAGTNVATQSIHTTNDMPIVLPPTFYALQLVPFNINPHYLDPEPESKHRGETRATRINEFHELHSNPVLALREGSALLVDDDKATLVGFTPAILFMQGQEQQEFEVDSDMSFLFK